MIAYKAFLPGCVCRGYQFHMGLNVTESANCAENGFHCAENPLDCLSYYSNIKGSVRYLVDAGGDIDEDSCDSKIACTHLTLIKKLTLKEFIFHSLAYMADHPGRIWNGHVKKDSGVARDGFTIVRGSDPIATGSLGDVLAFAKEQPEGEKITQVALTRVDGKKILPGCWYDIDFKERQVAEK